MKKLRMSEYSIKFYHYTEPYEYQGKVENRRHTKCTVYHNADHEGAGVVLGVGIAVCSPLDQFCYETGRKIALTKAIRGLDRGERARIWKEYWRQKANDKMRSLAHEVEDYFSNVRILDVS